MGRGTITILATAALLAPAAPAVAEDSAEGRCTINGETVFEDPIGNLPEEVAYHDVAAGTCTGTLNGDPIENEPIVMAGSGTGTIGCLGGVTDGFRGTITYTRGTETTADDVAFDFTATSAGAFTQFAGFVETDGGIGVAHLDYLPRSNDPSTLEQCAAGTFSRATYTATTQTFALR